MRVTRAVTKIRQDAKGDAANEAALLEGFQHLMGWHGPETMTTYIKTMNKRQAIKIILDDEEAQEQADGEAQAREITKHMPERSPKEEISQQNRIEEQSLHNDKDGLGWYED